MKGTNIHLHTAGVSLVISVVDDRQASITYWGRDLGHLDAHLAEDLRSSCIQTQVGNSIDEPVHVALLPQSGDGWLGRPGIEGHRESRSGFSPQLHTTAVRLDGREVEEFAEASTGTLEVDSVDPDAGIALTSTLTMLPSGLVTVSSRLTNTGSDDYHLDSLQHCAPVPFEASEILDFTGRWGLEHTPQRTPVSYGTHCREVRRGVTGPDTAWVMHVGTPGFGFRHGEIWATHLAWSGNNRYYVEKLVQGFQVMAAGEILLPGEVALHPGESYTSPDLYLNHAIGLDGVAARFHDHVRHNLHPLAPDRPVSLNVWEAVYFDQNLDKLITLADRAAAVGVERYVVDDGWFGSRRDDRSGLGDWTVSPDVWPNGLHPLVNHVKSLGMQFGLWFEPEMVNEDSDLARNHPDWLMAPGERLPRQWRHQQVLNLTIPQAWQYIHDSVAAIIEEYGLDYIKWDHNRNLLESGTRATGVPAVHEQTLATYRLIETLLAEHPGLEIESCSSGGSRVDLELMRRCSRIWVSDCIDPLERQTMLRWAKQLLPPEFLGNHIASATSHSSGRTHDLSFRAATAIFGHLGIEWDITSIDDDELAELKEWIDFYKENRQFLNTGTVVRADRADESLWLHGVVSQDRHHALFSLVARYRSPMSPRGNIRFPGLDPEMTYHVRPVQVGHPVEGMVDASWFDGVDLTGAALEVAGIQAPGLNSEHALLIEISGMSKN